MKCVFLVAVELFRSLNSTYNTWARVDLEFLFELNTEEKFHIYMQQLFCFNNINYGVIQGFPALRKAVTTHVKKLDIFSRVFDIANQLLTRHSLL